VAVGGEVAGWATLGRLDPDPLALTPVGSQGGGGVSVKLSRFGLDVDAVLAAAETVDGETAVYTERPGADGVHVHFRLDRPGAESVAVTGDFTGWEDRPMEQRDGVWTADVVLAPGTYHFGFVVDGEWHVPEEAPGRVADDWGRVNATLLVTEPAGQDDPDGDAGGSGHENE
jgi:hypothetical protein